MEIFMRKIDCFGDCPPRQTLPKIFQLHFKLQVYLRILHKNWF